MHGARPAAVALVLQVPAASSLDRRSATGDDLLLLVAVVPSDRTSATRQAGALALQQVAVATAQTKRLGRQVKREGRTVASLKKQVASLQKDVKALGG